ncbi:uncharacterized protein VNE69_03286 [Vairimorpha necatrix]|uniref:Uncharacterized protein n=1 Tax=Vairimorpha necatrix TaxID=6039 RepID=A0AAX4JAS1_9MICR
MKKIQLERLEKNIDRIKNKKKNVINGKILNRNVEKEWRIIKKTSRRKKKCANWEDVEVKRAINKPLVVKIKK